MIRRRFVFVLAILLLLANTPTVWALDLQECIERGLANSDRVLAAKAAMDQRRTERYAVVPNFVPQLSLQASQMWLDVHSTMPDMTIDLPAGLPAEQAALFNSIIQQIDFNTFTEVPDHNRDLRLQAYQPLSQLPQIAMYDRMAADAARLSTLAYESTKDQITLFLASNYLQMLIAQKKVEALQHAAEQLDRLLRDGAALRAHGVILEADLLKLQMHRSEVQLQLQQAQGDENYFRSYLAKLLDLPVDQIDPTEPAPPPSVNHDLEWYLARGEQHSRELRMIVLQESIAESSRNAAYLNLIPQVGAVAGADWNDDGLDTTPDRTYSCGFVLTWNFGGMGRDVLQARSSTYALAQAEHSANAARIDVRMAIEKAWRDAQLARQAVATNKTVLDQARENYRIEEERFRQNQTTTSDLLGAQTQLTAAQTGYSAARYMTILADESLAYLIGEHPFVYLSRANND